MKEMDKDLNAIFHIIKYCEKIKKVSEIFENDFSKFLLKKNFGYRDLCSFYIFQIGELVGVISDSLKNDNKHIPWRTIKNVRNIIGHEYKNVNFEIIWGIITEDIDKLNNNCREILEIKYPDYDKRLEDELSEEIE